MLPVATHIMIIANHQSPTITPIAMIVACSFSSSFMTRPPSGESLVSDWFSITPEYITPPDISNTPQVR